MVSNSLLVLKKARAMNTISAMITPRSKIMAHLKPLVAPVSNNTKNTGPMVNAKIIPKGIANKISSNIKSGRFPTNVIKVKDYLKMTILERNRHFKWYSLPISVAITSRVGVKTKTATTMLIIVTKNEFISKKYFKKRIITIELIV